MANFINKDKDHFKYGINQWTGEPNKPVFYNKEMALAVRGIKKPVVNLFLRNAALMIIIWRVVNIILKEKLLTKQRPLVINNFIYI